MPPAATGAHLIADAGHWRIGRLLGGFDAPFWPGKVEDLGERGRRRHGLLGGENPYWEGLAKRLAKPLRH